MNNLELTNCVFSYIIKKIVREKIQRGILYEIVKL